MKKVILVFAAFAITFGAFAQTDSTNKKMSPPDINKTDDGIDQNYDRNRSHNDHNYQMGKSHPDGAMMMNGKMMMVKNGQMTAMDRDMTMSNGTRIKSDGTCMMKDGTKTAMKEGQHMDMSGKLNHMKKNDDNMYLVPDDSKKPD
jgi:hypothetical protein